MSCNVSVKRPSLVLNPLPKQLKQLFMYMNNCNKGVALAICLCIFSAGEYLPSAGAAPQNSADQWLDAHETCWDHMAPHRGGESFFFCPKAPWRRRRQRGGIKKSLNASSSNLNWSYYPHRSSELVSPVWGIFFIANR